MLPAYSSDVTYWQRQQFIISTEMQKFTVEARQCSIYHGFHVKRNRFEGWAISDETLYYKQLVLSVWCTHKPGEVKYNTQEVNMKPVVDSPTAEKKNYTNNNLLSAIV